MILYDGLNAELKKKHIGKTELAESLGLSTRTVAKIAKNEKGWLTDTCLDGQDTFKKLLDMLEIEY